MIEEKGIVMEIKGTLAVVKAEESAECEGCGTKEMCRTVGDDKLLEAENPVGARVGDQVVFTVGAAEMLKAGGLFYLLPLLAFITGVVLGQTASPADWNADLVSAVLGFVFVAMAFGGVKLYTDRSKGTEAMRPRIVRITGTAA